MGLNTKKLVGLDTDQVMALALGGAAVPIINSVMGKVPGVNQVVSMINGALGPQVAGSAVPVIFGVALNLILDSKLGSKVPAGGKKYGKLIAEGAAAAGIMGIAMSMSQKYVAPMVGGVMSGINFTPRSMAGINFTPRPQYLNGGMGVGIIDAYKPSAADFGGYPDRADFGGADFGVKPDYALDKDVDEPDDDADDDDSSMSGSMG